jgi:KDO2-lipid IV(A) lauroyltransferase
MAHSAKLYRAPMFAAGEWLARRFPLGVIRRLAGWAGWLYAFTHPKRVAVVRHNLRLLDPSPARTSARRLYGEFGKTLADYFYIGTRPPEQAVRIIAQIDGAEHLQKAREIGKGALVVTAHFGLFELGGLLLAQHGFSTVVLTYPEPSRALGEWRSAFLDIARQLRRGQFVAALIDRPHPTDNTPVSLPNGTALFSTGILLLAAHGSVPVIPATMVRRADGAYHAQVFPPLFIEPRGTREETLQCYSQQIADTLLPVLCEYPEQWYQFVPLSPAEK